MPPYGQQQTVPYGQGMTPTGLTQMGGGGGNPMGEFMPYLQQAQQIYAMLGGEPSPTGIMSLATKLQGQAAPSQMTSSQAKALQGLSAAENLVNQFERSLAEIGTTGGPLARLTGAGKSIAGSLGFAPKVRAYEAMRQGTTAAIARALGDTGALSDVDIARAQALIPTINDSTEEAQYKIQNLRSIFQANKQDIMSIGGGTQEMGYDPYAEQANMLGF